MLELPFAALPRSDGLSVRRLKIVETTVGEQEAAIEGMAVSAARINILRVSGSFIPLTGINFVVSHQLLIEIGSIFGELHRFFKKRFGGHCKEFGWVCGTIGI